MSLSLSPPPRKPSVGGAKNSPSSSRSPPLSPPTSRRHHPRVNTSFAAKAMQSQQTDKEEDEKRAFDLALAKLLGETSLQDDTMTSYSGHSNSNSNHLYHTCGSSSSTHDLERPARPQSIASASSLSSSYSGQTRWVSQTTHNGSGAGLNDGTGASCTLCGTNVSSSLSIHSTTSSSKVPYNTQLPSPISTELVALPALPESSPSSAVHPPCAACSSFSRLRSGSICSSCLLDESDERLLGPGGAALTATSLAALNHHSNSSQRSLQSSDNLLDVYTTYPYNHRNSLHLFEDQGELTTSLEVLKSIVPSQVRSRLAYHLDECWLVEFSPSGEYLASSGADNCVMLWGDFMTPNTKVIKSFTNDRVATSMKWSPDSKYLAINMGQNSNQGGYANYYIVLIEVETSRPVKLLHPTMVRSACGMGWFPNSDKFVTVSVDGLFCIWNLEGELERTYQYSKPISNMYMATGHEIALIGTTAYEIVVIDLSANVPDEHRAKTLDNLTAQIVSLVFRRDNIVAVSVKYDPDLPRPAHVLLYNWQTMTHLRTLEVDTYQNNLFVMVPSFIGPQEELFITGSENGLIHVWDVQSGELVQTLEGHSKHVGGVTGNKAEPGMMATCSDDNHVIVWITKELGRKLEISDQEWHKKQQAAPPLPLNLKKGW